MKNRDNMHRQPTTPNPERVIINLSIHALMNNGTAKYDSHTGKLIIYSNEGGFICTVEKSLIDEELKSINENLKNTQASYYLIYEALKDVFIIENSNSINLKEKAQNLLKVAGILMKIAAERFGYENIVFQIKREKEEALNMIFLPKKMEWLTFAKIFVIYNRLYGYITRRKKDSSITKDFETKVLDAVKELSQNIAPYIDNRYWVKNNKGEWFVANDVCGIWYETPHTKFEGIRLSLPVEDTIIAATRMENITYE